MAVLVSDTSVVIDLDRGGLLEAVFGLAHDFAVPDLLFHRELAGPLGDRLVGLGLRIESLTSQEVTEASRISRAEPSLSGPDAFAYALAVARGWPLLSGDGALRRACEQQALEVHGVLWVLDRLEDGAGLPHATLLDGLSAIAAHPRCRLPRGEIAARLKRYGG